MSFTNRIAKLAAAAAPAHLREDPDPSPQKVDPYPEPPARTVRRKKRRAAEEEPDRDPVPGWIARRILGRPHEQDPRADYVPPPPTWPGDVFPLVDRILGDAVELLGEEEVPLPRLDVSDLPPAPWELKPWEQVTDSTAWLARLRQDLEQGTRGDRARTGAIQEDLRFLALALRGGATPDELEAARRGPRFG